MNTKPTFLMLLLFLAVILGACDEIDGETAVVPTPTSGITAPPGVVMARNAALEFVRTSANMCVPPAGVTWQVSTDPDKTPVGFGVYRFTAESCSITVSYALENVDTLYNVAVSNPVVGFCWEAMVDDQGTVVRTGASAQLEPEGNPAAIYCTQQGYDYTILTIEDGSKCSACVFPDGSACKAWDFFHGDCQPGDNPAEE